MKPNFFCIGVPKSATTTLFSVLVDSGTIYNSRLKEPHFLTYQGKREFVLKSGGEKAIMDTWAANSEEYFELYSGAKEGQLTADFSTHYLKDIKLFAKNGNELFGADFFKTPILVVLRHPVDRAFSHFAMKVRDGSETLSFVDAINPAKIKERMENGYLPSFDYLSFSQYAKSILFLKSNFKNVLILDQKMIKTDFSVMMEEINEFLQIGVKINSLPPVLNQSGQPKKGLLSSQVNKFIYQDNWMKRIVPEKWKNKFGNKLKAKAYSLAMKPLKVTREEYQAASNLLKSEIEFYEQMFK